LGSRDRNFLPRDCCIVPQSFVTYKCESISQVEPRGRRPAAQHVELRGLDSHRATPPTCLRFPPSRIGWKTRKEREREKKKVLEERLMLLFGIINTQKSVATTVAMTNFFSTTPYTVHSSYVFFCLTSSTRYLYRSRHSFFVLPVTIAAICKFSNDRGQYNETCTER
jgi:hypothetical protein